MRNVDVLFISKSVVIVPHYAADNAENNSFVFIKLVLLSKMEATFTVLNWIMSSKNLNEQTYIALFLYLNNALNM